ncbi:MAG: hypothetical protein ABF651_00085 [Sporolactobacillus sp.]
MTVANFIPSIWEARLLANYHNHSVADVITTAPTQILGNKIIFNRVSSVAIKDYDSTTTKPVSFDGLTTPEVEIDMDQKKYFAFKINDVDKIQTAGDLFDPTVAEASATLSETIDTYILNFYTSASADNLVGNDTTPIALDPTSAYESIVDLGTKLGSKKVPKLGSFVVVNSAVLGLLAKNDRFTRNPVVLANGIVEGQTINGMQVVVSEQIANAAGKYKILAVGSGAIGYGCQINDLEAIRLQDDFADGVRGLCVHGATVLRPEAVAVLTATF